MLEIVDELPADYIPFNCCFAENRGRSNFCYKNFGVNGDDFLLNDKTGKLYECSRLSFYGHRGRTNHIKTASGEGKIICQAVPIEGQVEGSGLDEIADFEFLWFCQLKNGPLNRLKNGPLNHNESILSFAAHLHEYQ